MKEKYERTELELIEFQSQDVIMTSEPDDYANPDDHYQAPIL